MGYPAGIGNIVERISVGSNTNTGTYSMLGIKTPR